MKLDLELDKALNEIKKNKPKNLLLQLPDGLKPQAKEIINELTKRTNLKTQDIAIWSGSCYGACDTPDIKGYDMLIQFGHSRWIT